MINRLQEFYNNSAATAHGAYIATHQAAASVNQRVTQYARDSLTSLQQQAADAKASLINTTTQIYNHRLTPYVIAGLFSIAVGSLIGLPVTTSFILGISTKLIAEGIDSGLQRITNVMTRVLRYLGYNDDLQIPATWKQTASILPIGLGCFALGLNAPLVSAVARMASVVGVAVIGSFALGYATHA